MGPGTSMPIKFEDALPDMECLPESLVGTRFYEPTNRGLEQRIAERLEEIRARKRSPIPIPTEVISLQVLPLPSAVPPQIRKNPL